MLGTCLLLNSSYEALCLIPVERAVVLTYQGKVELVCQHKEKVLHTQNSTYPLPTVVRVIEYKKIGRRKIQLTKRNIHKRDNYECQYCGHSRKDGLVATVDHIIPKSRGGKDEWKNVITACKRCNNFKDDRTPNEANMKLRKQPTVPNHITFLKSMSKEYSEDWEQFLFC